MCDTKICKSCREAKSLSKFKKCNNTKDKLLSRCTECVKNNLYEVLEDNFKRCVRCDIVKDLNYFGKNKRSKDGLHPRCRECLNSHAKDYKERRVPNVKPDEGYKKCSSCNVEKHVDNFYINPNLSMGVHSECKDCCLAKSSQWAKDNPDKMAINGKKYRNNNKEKERIRAKKYVENNKESVTSYKTSYKKANRARALERERIRRLENPLVRLRGVIRCSIKDAFKRVLGGVFKKSKHSEEVLGCTMDKFTNHLEKQFLNWMTFSNHGNCESYDYNCSWNIDHIIPITYAKTEEEIYLLNHWSNFQPLCSKVNTVIKSATVYPCTNLELRITFWEDRWEYV